MPRLETSHETGHRQEAARGRTTNPSAIIRVSPIRGNMPTTRPGRIAARLLLLAAVCLAAFFSLIAAGERGGDTFFSNPALAVPILAAAALAIAAGAGAGFAIVRRRERSPVAIGAAVIGALVLAYTIAEIAAPH